MGKLSHIDAQNRPTMVDVSDKTASDREAHARTRMRLPDEAAALISDDDIQTKKGPVFATAIIAGVMAAKKTHELIPLCHPLMISKVTVDFTETSNPAGIRVEAMVKVGGQTGVEMEALTAVSVTCLTIYDMLKAVDRGMTFNRIRLLEKSGGKSGHFKAENK